MGAFHEALQSELFIRSVVWLVVAAAIAVTVWIAKWERRRLEELTPRDFQRTFKGTKPWKCDGLNNRITALESFNKRRLASTFLHLAVLTLCGIVVPTLLLVGAIQHFDWLFPGQKFLVDASGNSTMPPAFPGIFSFAFSEFMHSAADLLGAAGKTTTSFAVAPANASAHATLIFYHLLIAGYLGVLASTGVLLIRVARSSKEEIALLKDRRDKQCKLEGKMPGV